VKDEALERVRVAPQASWCPAALDLLRARAVHRTGLFLLAPHLTHENYEEVLAEAAGK
jgi:hypothetical protein